MNIKAKLILSRYKEDFSWIKEYTDNYFVYNKGEVIEGDYRILNVENIGGNQRDIFKFIIDNYENLPELMAFVQAFIFPDGFVYVCPSAELAEENNLNVNNEFRICDIEHIVEFYKQPNIIQRKHKCSFCKYASQNELIDDILTETDHNEFV